MPDTATGRCLDCAHWHPEARRFGVRPVEAKGCCDLHNMTLPGWEFCGVFRERVPVQGALLLESSEEHTDVNGR